ncbi:hypothetical protein CGLO_11138 [Colletotrichum gloeosporioides Cg-14]|uniref:Uncharacterized protein n=1 Tax=Colletotrichum gloeosporioides (strain Cg-14) TaxID=1237896 RepID=T0LCT7_COLGC|nr:hypothetical protein CGLO_11138 [Colletotrichum gloeosporioides Cg-14]
MRSSISQYHVLDHGIPSSKAPSSGIWRSPGRQHLLFILRDGDLVAD